MRNFTLILSLFITSFSFSQIPSFVKILGKKGIDQNIECFCIDPKDRLTVGYYKSPKIDTLYFKNWDGNQWSEPLIPLHSVRSQKRNAIKCIYNINKKSDTTLFVSTNYRQGGKIKTGIWGVQYKTAVSNYLLGEFKTGSSGGDIVIADLKIKKNPSTQVNELVVFGNFDIIDIGIREIHIPKIAVFEHDGIANNWGINQSVEKRIKESLLTITLPVATSNDTSIIIGNNNQVIYRFIYPDSLKVIRLPDNSKFPYSGVFHLGNKWLITRLNSDSILYYNGKEFIKRKLDKILSANLNIINSTKGVIIAEDTKESSRLFLLDTVKNNIRSVYHHRNVTAITPQSALINSKSSIFYRFNIPILYRDTVFDHLVEIINLKVFNVKPIIAWLFYDKNNNYKMDGSDEAVDGKLLNRTFGYTLSSTKGKFEDNIPYYANAEYELVSHNTSLCLKLPFTGSIKTNIFNKDKDKDTLYFPLQLVKIPKNINVKSWGKAIARMWDTIPLNIRIFNRDCDPTLSNVSVTVTLDTGTTFINSTPPPASINKNVLIFNINNIKSNRDSFIKFNVLYSNKKYKIDQYIKHYVRMVTPYKEDNTDNSDSIVQKMVYSYDPNAKYSNPQGTILSDINNIRYYIEFQNEGNDVARRVTIVDTLDTHIPVYEFQMVGASHAYSVSLKNNVVTWVFDNINLPAKSVNEKGSQGYIVFDAKIIANLGIGDSIKNKAYIYFDYNDPIITNLSFIDRAFPFIDESDNFLRVYPNPATATVTIENKHNTKQAVKIFNMLGQEVIDVTIEPIDKNIQSISNWPRGMYFVRTTKGKFQKFLVH